VSEILSGHGSEEIPTSLSEIKPQLFSPYFITISYSCGCHKDVFPMGAASLQGRNFQGTAARKCADNLKFKSFKSISTAPKNMHNIRTIFKYYKC
jgi:hypothetical protein